MNIGCPPGKAGSCLSFDRKSVERSLPQNAQPTFAPMWHHGSSPTPNEHRVEPANCRCRPRPAALVALLDHVVGDDKQCRGDCEAKSLRSPGVDRKAELGRLDRQGTAARMPLPLLRRPHVHHRDFRARSPAASSTDRTSRRNQDRYLMIATTISRIIVRVSRWSPTGNAPAWPDRSQAPPMSLASSPKYRDSDAHSKPINQSSVLDHAIPTPHRPLLNHRAVVKST